MDDLGGAPVPVEVEIEETPAQASANLAQKAADVYTKWIPGDVVVIYVGLTSAFRGTLDKGKEADTTPHAWGLLATDSALARFSCRCSHRF